MAGPRNPIACRTSSYEPFAEMAFEHMTSLGLRHVELMVPSDDDLEAVATRLQSHGLCASSMHGDCDLDKPDLEGRVARQMPAYQALNCKIMFTSVRAGDLPVETACAKLRAAGDVVQEAGVMLAVETHPDLATNADVMLRTIEAVDHPHVRINFDTANLYFYNHNIDCVEQLRRVVQYVAAVHLKDTDGGYRHWHFPALGEGIVDFPGLFAILDEAGFEGPCTLEIEGIEGEERTRELIRARLAASVDYLRSLGRI